MSKPIDLNIPPSSITASKSTVIKPWYQSKTLWVNIIMVIVASANYFAQPEHTIALNVASIALAIGVVANIVLRIFFTNTALDVGVGVAKEMEEGA